MRPDESPTARAGGKTVAKSGGDPMRDMFNGQLAQNKFREILGDEGPAFAANTLQAVQRNSQLSKALPSSVIIGAVIGASLKLSLDPSLGEAALVPYTEKNGTIVAQFQIMTKGLVQLGWRSGLYKDMNVVPIYEDEFESEDIKTGRVIVNPKKDGWRSKAKLGETVAEKHIIGYLAFFELMNGAYKEEFWYVTEIDAHGKKFSKSYNFVGGPWQAHKEAMRAKTVLKALLNKWGPKSITMQKAVQMDGGRASDTNLTNVEPDDASFFIQDDTGGAPVTEAPEPSAEEKALKMGVPDDNKTEPSTAVPEQKDGLGIF